MHGALTVLLVAIARRCLFALWPFSPSRCKRINCMVDGENAGWASKHNKLANQQGQSNAGMGTKRDTAFTSGQRQAYELQLCHNELKGCRAHVTHAQIGRGLETKTRLSIKQAHFVCPPYYACVTQLLFAYGVDL
jgi:hypothetical protein